MYEDCLQAIQAWKYGSLREITIELVMAYVIPYLEPLVPKYDAAKNMEIFKEMFEISRTSELVWLEVEELCEFLNKIFRGEPFEIRSERLYGVLFLKGGNKAIFEDEDTVIPFLNFLQKTTPYHWVCYPHGISVICCHTWDKVLGLLENHIDGYNNAEIQEYIFSDKTWNRLEEERSDYTCVKRKSVYDEDCGWEKEEELMRLRLE